MKQREKLLKALQAWREPLVDVKLVTMMRSALAEVEKEMGYAPRD